MNIYKIFKGYFDLKIMDGAVHRRYTGCDNRLILRNFSTLSKHFECLQARMPVIPGINNDHHNIIATAEFLKRHGHNTIHCLPYHKLGEAKKERIGRPLKPLPLKALEADELTSIYEFFSKEGIDVLIYD